MLSQGPMQGKQGPQPQTLGPRNTYPWPESQWTPRLFLVPPGWVSSNAVAHSTPVLVCGQDMWGPFEDLRPRGSLGGGKVVRS